MNQKENQHGPTASRNVPAHPQGPPAHAIYDFPIVGIADFWDDGVAGEAVGGLERTITLLEAHAMHEEKHVHPQIKSKAPDVVASLEKDHQNYNKVYAELRRLSPEAGNATGDRKAALGGEIYEKYNEFVGEYLGHMVLEEGDMQ